MSNQPIQQNSGFGLWKQAEEKAEKCATNLIHRLTSYMAMHLENSANKGKMSGESEASDG